MSGETLSTSADAGKTPTPVASTSGRSPVGTPTPPRALPPAKPGVAGSKPTAPSDPARRARLTNLRDEAAGVRSEVTARFSELSEARERITSLTEELRVRTEELAVANTELSATKTKLVSTETALALTNEELRNARGALGEDAEAFDELMAELRALRTEASKLAVLTSSSAPTTEEQGSADPDVK